MNRRRARIEALNRAIALLNVQVANGDGSDLGEGIEEDFPDEGDQRKVYREVGRVADQLGAWRDRLEGRP